MDRSYEVTYFTPSDGTILYTVKALERYEPQPDFVFSPSTAKENELKKAAVYSSIGFAIVKAAGALAHSWQREYVGKQVAALA